jgi:hypothetical protein
MLKNIIIKTSAKKFITESNFETILDTVKTTNTKKGIIDNIRYTIQKHSIILF